MVQIFSDPSMVSTRSGDNHELGRVSIRITVFRDVFCLPSGRFSVLRVKPSSSVCCVSDAQRITAPVVQGSST